MMISGPSVEGVEEGILGRSQEGRDTCGRDTGGREAGGAWQ